MGGTRTDLNQKARKDERVLMKHNPPTITNHFTYVSPEHGEEKAPAAPSETLNDADYHADGKKDHECYVCAERRSVFVHAGGDGACLKGTVGVWPECHEAVGQGCGRHGWVGPM